MAQRLLMQLLSALPAGIRVIGPHEPEPSPVGVLGIARLVRVDVEPGDQRKPAVGGVDEEPDLATVSAVVSVRAAEADVAANTYALANLLATVAEVLDGGFAEEAVSTHRLTLHRAGSMVDPAETQSERVATGAVTVTGWLERLTGRTPMALP